MFSEKQILPSSDQVGHNTTLLICIMYTSCTGSSLRSGRNDDDKIHVCLSTLLRGESFSID